jgi:hypothetical protein
MAIYPIWFQTCFCTCSKATKICKIIIGPKLYIAKNKDGLVVHDSYKCRPIGPNLYIAKNKDDLAVHDSYKCRPCLGLETYAIMCFLAQGNPR